MTTLLHFEPDLVLRDLRERERRISLHWPRYPEAFGVIIGDFNICEPEEERDSTSGIKPSQKVTRGKSLLSAPIFLMS